MFMHRLAVADVADLEQPRMLLCTQAPRSATRGYSCARSLIPGLLIWICFVIHRHSWRSKTSQISGQGEVARDATSSSKSTSKRR